MSNSYFAYIKFSVSVVEIMVFFQLSFVKHHVLSKLEPSREIVLTYWYSTGQSRTFSVASRWCVGLHDAIVQEMRWPCIWECRALKLCCVHFMNETGKKEKYFVTITNSGYRRYSSREIQEILVKDLPTILNFWTLITNEHTDFIYWKVSN